MSTGRHDPYLPATDMPRFLRELAEFVGFDEAAAARFFLGDDGEPDRARLERRRHSLARWLRETAQASLTHEHAYYLLAIGLSHSHRPHGPGGVVPAHLVVGAMSLTQTALADAFAAELPAGEALAASGAWNKLLLVHLAALLLGYLPPRPG